MEPEDKEEARFIARLASRDERAFNELVVLYQERVFRILLRMLGRRDEVTLVESPQIFSQEDQKDRSLNWAPSRFRFLRHIARTRSSDSRSNASNANVSAPSRSIF